MSARLRIRILEQSVAVKTSRNVSLTKLSFFSHFKSLFVQVKSKKSCSKWKRISIFSFIICDCCWAIMQPSNKKKQNVSVRDKLDGNEIDLSLLELSEVPVKELVTLPNSCTILTLLTLFFNPQAAVSRGTRLDLSNNKIVALPVCFSLTCPKPTLL